MLPISCLKKGPQTARSTLNHSNSLHAVQPQLLGSMTKEGESGQILIILLTYRTHSFQAIYIHPKQERAALWGESLSSWISMCISMLAQWLTVRCWLCKLVLVLRALSLSKLIRWFLSGGLKSKPRLGHMNQWLSNIKQGNRAPAFRLLMF